MWSKAAVALVIRALQVPMDLLVMMANQEKMVKTAKMEHLAKTVRLLLLVVLHRSLASSARLDLQVPWDQWEPKDHWDPRELLVHLVRMANEESWAWLDLLVLLVVLDVLDLKDHLDLMARL